MNLKLLNAPSNRIEDIFLIKILSKMYYIYSYYSITETSFYISESQTNLGSIA